MHIFLIICLFTAGISPACKIMGAGSGKSIFEICSAWGTAKAAIPIPPIPFSLASGEEQQNDELPAGTIKQQPCAFCFAGDHIKGVSVEPIQTSAYGFVFKTSVRAQSDAIVQKARREVYTPRGPPTLFV